MFQERKQTEIDAAWMSFNGRAGERRLQWLEAHLKRQKRRCFYCNILMTRETADRRPTIDHVVPRSEGGADAIENTVAACYACNAAKGSMGAIEYKSHPTCLAREKLANTPPDRLSVDPDSKYYDSEALDRGVAIRWNGREYTKNVREYSVSEGWIRVAPGKSVDRFGKPITVKLKGTVEHYFPD
jgi:hypothetical protein